MKKKKKKQIEDFDLSKIDKNSIEYKKAAFKVDVEWMAVRENNKYLKSIIEKNIPKCFRR